MSPMQSHDAPITNQGTGRLRPEVWFIAMIVAHVHPQEAGMLQDTVTVQPTVWPGEGRGSTMPTAQTVRGTARDGSVTT